MMLNPISNFRFWCQTVLPTVYDDSLSYYELLNKVVEKLNETIDGQNALANDFKFLLEYVNNYLENENFQEMVNNKLDEMAQSGELSDLIIAISTKNGVYDSFRELEESDIPNGCIATTTSYINGTDYGGATYFISDNKLSDISISIRGGRYATILSNNIKPEQLGYQFNNAFDINTFDPCEDVSHYIEQIANSGKNVLLTSGSRLINGNEVEYIYNMANSAKLNHNFNHSITGEGGYAKIRFYPKDINVYDPENFDIGIKTCPAFIVETGYSTSGISTQKDRARYTTTFFDHIHFYSTASSLIPSCFILCDNHYIDEHTEKHGIWGGNFNLTNFQIYDTDIPLTMFSCYNCNITNGFIHRCGSSYLQQFKWQDYADGTTDPNTYTGTNFCNLITFNNISHISGITSVAYYLNHVRDIVFNTCAFDNLSTQQENSVVFKSKGQALDCSCNGCWFERIDYIYEFKIAGNILTLNDSRYVSGIGHYRKTTQFTDYEESKNYIKIKTYPENFPDTNYRTSAQAMFIHDTNPDYILRSNTTIDYDPFSSDSFHLYDLKTNDAKIRLPFNILVDERNNTNDPENINNKAYVYLTSATSDSDYVSGFFDVYVYGMNSDVFMSKFVVFKRGLAFSVSNEQILLPSSSNPGYHFSCRVDKNTAYATTHRVARIYVQPRNADASDAVIPIRSIKLMVKFHLTPFSPDIGAVVNP